MRELVWQADRSARWSEVDDLRSPGPYEALVRPIAVAACDLDVGVAQGWAPLPGPFRVGHEGVADVLAVGDAVTGVQRGDRVIVPFQISCGDCATCRRGRTDSCNRMPLMSMYGLAPLAGFDAGGLLADAARVPFADAMLVKVPTGSNPADLASCSDNVTDGWRCVGPYSDELAAAPDPDRRVLVMGMLSIGLYASAVALALGAQVDYVDTDPDRLSTAERLGATVIDALLPPRGHGPYPVTVATSSDEEGLRAAIRATWPGGVCTDAGLHFGGDVALPLLAMYTRGIRFVTGRTAARAALPAVLELVTGGHLQPGLITDRVLPWEAAAQEWPRMTAKTVFVRD